MEDLPGQGRLELRRFYLPRNAHSRSGMEEVLTGMGRPLSPKCVQQPSNGSLVGRRIRLWCRRADELVFTGEKGACQELKFKLRPDGAPASAGPTVETKSAPTRPALPSRGGRIS